MWFVILAACALVGVWVYYNNSNMKRMAKVVEDIPGPRCYPIVHNALEFGMNTSEYPANMERLILTHGTTLKLWLAYELFVIILKPEDVEIVLGSNKTIDKARDYEFLRPWVGNGLLTSTGPKWRKHRKILTPTFHFNILEQFVDVFNANGDILVEMLRERENGPTFDVYKYITLYTLDNICDTAMGVSVNAQRNSNSEYVRAVRDAAEIVMLRIVKPWLRPEFLFHRLPIGKLHDRSLKLMHEHTNDVIKTRRAEIAARKAERSEEVKDSSVEDQDSSQYTGVKKRLAFLDLLIEASADGNVLTDEEIREEVDTFMFEGHDTTSSAMSFALYLLSRHQDVQEKVADELREIFVDENEATTMRHLQDMRYVERVIKETLRLYPSVGQYGRDVTEDITLSDGRVIPAGATVVILPAGTQRDADQFDDGLVFDPDRFSPENVQGRHPYAYIPFSAGPRNCIGQKFAMLELKSGLSHVLRNYRVLPAPEDEEVILSPELILKSNNGMRLKIVPRK